MSLGPSPSSKKVLNIKFPEQNFTKFENLNNSSNFNNTKTSFTRPLLHPSFTQKLQMNKNLPSINSRSDFRCVTRQISRKKDSLFDNSNSATLLISDRSKSSQNENSEASPKKLTPNLKKPIFSRIKTPNHPPSQNIILTRNPSINWIRTKKHPKSPDQDPYHCSKFLSNTIITNFYDLLGVYYERPSVFPYFNKNTKEILKEFLKPKANNSEENGQHAKPSKKIKNSQYLRQISIVPVLETRYFSLVNVKFNQNLIIFNLESLTIGKTIKTRPSVLKTLKKINEILHIVLVSSINSELFEDVISNFALAGIKISAFYGVSRLPVKTFKFLDYSEIFSDFGIESGLKQCIIVSNHILFDIEDRFEHVGSRFGAKLKVNCEKVPAVAAGLDDSPAVVLLPGFISGRPVKRLKDLVKLILREGENGFALDFFGIVKKMNGFKCDLPNQVLKNYLSVNEKFSKNYSFAHNQFFIV